MTPVEELCRKGGIGQHSINSEALVCFLVRPSNHLIGRGQEANLFSTSRPLSQNLMLDMQRSQRAESGPFHMLHRAAENSADDKLVQIVHQLRFDKMNRVVANYRDAFLICFLTKPSCKLDKPL